ncbi:SRPBCC domain-containing protein [Methylobacterium sp. E-005]|uniref:SRPBCC domain-containing protein n=1 Tax=Methylobacterium sp. E-005 TaxID=2836549 RepID=UPI001FBC12CC|nr:SRPBCC domain-containing protein [Methylobacterium sp. E-005]MCJ2088953.1 SRPBCC domain-containing protein [Methylobacterium sp. E-005]
MTVGKGKVDNRTADKGSADKGAADKETAGRISSAAIAIPARAGMVWSVLTDLESYPDWNPFIRKAEGQRRAGARWRLELTRNGRSYRTLRVQVTCWEPGRRLTWRSGIATPHLITGTHDVRITETRQGVDLVQAQTFAGWLAPVLFPWLRARAQARFAEMNAALRDEVARRTAEMA